MSDYRQIEMLIHRARVARSAYLGELIGNGIFAVWSSARRLANHASASVQKLVETPDEYSTPLPRRF